MKLENIKVFSAMTAEEQERWVCEFTEWMDKGRRLAKLSSGWSRNDITDMEQGLRLLASWPFCEDYCEKTAHFADYDRRAYRLPLYIDKVVEELAAGLTIQTIDGRKVVQVSPSVPLRRRGRPTKEEIAARLRGETLVVQGDDAEARRRRAIAKLLGMEVIVSGEAPREKNNAELKAEREARKAEGNDEIPVGAIVVSGDDIIGRAHNQTELLHDVTAHAEILALSAATESLGAKYLTGCTLYVTLEPCVMCAGALGWAQVGRIVYGASDEKRGFERLGRSMLHPKTEVTAGVRGEECGELVKEFFRKKR